MKASVITRYTSDVIQYLLVVICFPVVCFSLMALFSGCGNDSDQPTSTVKSGNTTTTGSSMKATSPVSQASAPSSSQTSPPSQGSELMSGDFPSSNNTQRQWPFLSMEDSQDTGIATNLTTKNFVVIFDSSGSMGETECGDGRAKLDVAKEAVTQWADTIPHDADLGLVAFYHDLWAELNLASAGEQKKLFADQINKVWASAGTPLTQAMERAYAQLTKAGKKQLGYGEYTIVVVTDGIANAQSALKFTVKKILTQSPVNIYTIGFCIGEDHSLNQPGRTTYRSADNPEALKEGLRQVLAESVSFDEKEFLDE